MRNTRFSGPALIDAHVMNSRHAGRPAVSPRRRRRGAQLQVSGGAHQLRALADVAGLQPGPRRYLDRLERLRRAINGTVLGRSISRRIRRPPGWDVRQAPGPVAGTGTPLRDLHGPTRTGSGGRGQLRTYPTRISQAMPRSCRRAGPW